MRINSINYNSFNVIKRTNFNNDSRYPSTNQNFSSNNFENLGCDFLQNSRCYVSFANEINFCGIKKGGEILKKLANYGITDMYTGREMLSPGLYEKWQNNNIFDKPLKEFIYITEKYKNTLSGIELKIYNILERKSKKTPNATIIEVLDKMKKSAELDLIEKQSHILGELCIAANKMPKDRIVEFYKLLKLTTKRIDKHPVLLPFSEREFRYKLFKILDNIKYKNRNDNKMTVRKLKRLTMVLFPSNKPTTKFMVKKNNALKKQVRKYQTPNEILRNIKNLNSIKNIVNRSNLKNNKELIQLLNDAYEKIQGIPIVEPFKRKSFIHDLEKITNTLEDKHLAHSIQQIAIKLPRAKNDLSAFIVKYANTTNQKIGEGMFLGSVCSVDHLKAKKGGGANTIGNFGLTSRDTNSEKSNMPFDRWIELYPNSRKNIQKYVNRLIELYHSGVFKEIGLSSSYIQSFAATVKKLTAKNKPLYLDLSGLEK